MKFLNSLLADKTITTSNHESVKEFFSFKNNSITSATAQRLVNVFGCVNIKANALSIIPIKVYNRTENGKEEDRSNPLYNLLRYAPNPNLTASEWKKMISQDLDLRGNHYCQIVFNTKGEVKALYPLQADYMTVEWDTKRTKKYTYNGIVVPSYRILHLMDVPDSEGLIGLTRIEIARETLEYNQNVSSYGNKVFKNGTSPSGIFTHKGRLSLEAHERLQNDLEKKYTGEQNIAKTLLLEEDMTFTPIQMKNTDAQWIESKKLNREEIATLFGVPVSSLNDGENTAYGNLEQKEQSFYTNTIFPVIVMIEERLRLKLLVTDKQKQEKSIKFKHNALMRADTATRLQYYKDMHSIASISSNEVRSLEDMNGYTGGDEKFMQLSYDTVENIKKGENNDSN